MKNDISATSCNCMLKELELQADSMTRGAIGRRHGPQDPHKLSQIQCRTLVLNLFRTVPLNDDDKKNCPLQKDID